MLRLFQWVDSLGRAAFVRTKWGLSFAVGGMAYWFVVVLQDQI